MGNIMQGPGQDIFGYSQDLWKDVALDRIFGGKDRNVGWGVRDDFTNFAATAATSSSLTNYISEGNYYRAFELKGTNATACIIPDEAGWTVPTGFDVYSPNGQAKILPAGSVIPTPGAITFTPAAASDNAQLCLAANQARATATYPPGMFYPYPLTNGVKGDVIFECRFKLSDLATGATTAFIGLASTLAVASGVPCATTTFSNTPALLGFGCLSGDAAGKIGLVYNKAGGTVSHQSVANMAGLNLLTLGGATGVTSPSPTILVNGAGGIPSAVPTTYKGAYMKLGFRYSASSNTLTPYINGVAQDGRVAPNKVIGSGTLSTNLGTAAPGTGSSTLWPAVPMTLAAGLWQTGTTYQTMTIDWWQCVQLVG